MTHSLKHLFEPWTWKMAWRDTRTSRRRLAVFSLSVVFGVAALVAIGCFRKSLEVSVDEQSRGLLGADLVIASRQPFSSTEEALFKSVAGEQSREVSFSSMIYFPQTGGTRLAQIRALGGGFPFYGAMDVTPTNAASEFRKPGRSEEHTSELQSPCNLVCRLLLEKKKIRYDPATYHLTGGIGPTSRGI